MGVFPLNKEKIKRALDEDIFSQNPFDEAFIERTINKVFEDNQKSVLRVKYNHIFHIFITICVGLLLVIGGLHYFGNKEESKNLGASKIENNNINHNIDDQSKEETKDEIMQKAEEILTNVEALEAFNKIPKETQHNFDEYLLQQYNVDPDFREKVTLGIKKAKYLSKNRLIDLVIKMPLDDYVAVFNNHGDRVIIVGESWSKIKNEFLSLDHETQQLIKNVLNNIGREFVLGNGEIVIPDDLSSFKSDVTWNEMRDVVKERIKNDIESKVNGIENIKENLQNTNLLLYKNLQEYGASYKNVKNEEIMLFHEYLGVNFNFFIFSYLILEPKPVEVLAEPKYRSNEEQVDIVLSSRDLQQYYH
jgi:hypothetical protein